jgi:alpha-amylase
MTRALDVQGYRLDDVKGMSTQFIPQLLDHGALKGKFAVGEFFDDKLSLDSYPRTSTQDAEKFSEQ